ncbi:MAG: 4Fe-4S dicluster domain-containing protein [Methylocystis sp.]|uniref:4Fe-4S dicluster domain-containing protein n=1 Tax=Methylocystis sp. TaxID=1911079 RepID=UPI003DA5F9BD
MSQIGRQWRSLDERAGTTPPDTDEFADLWETPAPDRRSAMKLMAAAWALAGAGACSDADETLIPAVRAPPDVIQGAPQLYSTAFVHEGYAAGVLVKHWMGRPIKVEGNPRHPASLGAADAMAQAQLLDFYNPDRSWAVTHKGQPSTIPALERALAEQRESLAASSGEGFVILTGAVASTTLSAQLESLRQKYPAARWLHWEPISRAGAERGAVLAYGRPLAATFNLQNADVILAIDSDLLSAAPGALLYARDFAARRNPTRASAMNRLYAIEPGWSLTGAAADHRIIAGPDALRSAVLALAAAIFNRPGPEEPPWLAAAVADLKAHHGRALIHVGPEQPPETHALAFAMNEALGARGQTLNLIEPVLHPSADEAFTLAALVDEMNSGKISALVIIDSNPVFTAGAVDFAEALKRVPFTLTLTTTPTETSDATLWAVPMTHAWESWSDGRAFDGTATILQPQALPLYGGFDPHRLLSLFLQATAGDSKDLVQQSWKPRFPTAFDSSWRDALAQGAIPDTASRKVESPIRTDAASLTPPDRAEAALNLLLRPDPYIWDGRFAENAWLQELPRPISKMTWDNPLLVPTQYAQTMQLSDGDLVDISAGGRSVTAPVLIAPGQAQDCVIASLGFGRRRAGYAGLAAGVDFFPLSGAQSVPTIRKLGQRVGLARTERHHAMRDDHGTYARRDTLADFLAGKTSPALEEGPFLYRWKPEGPAAWGMSIDLNACIGCGACIVACQAENNVPVVGKEQVLREREMHWLRIDRYFDGPAEDPRISFQPVLCMHCEQAPCEPVCPVGATMHDAEGLNVMVYNRCIGTRFCSNNCPYKVRRFNYFAFAEAERRPPEARNPDVTVRARGVMEKCTFCIQRIAQARIEADKTDQPVAEIQTACQATCPTGAFSFGNLASADSDVVRRKRSPLAYALLADQNTVPRVTYEQRITNENPAITEAPE